MGGDGRRGPVAREAALIAVALVACAGVACAAVGEEVVDMGECVALAKGIPDFTGNLVEKGGDPSFFFFLHIPRVAGRTFNFCFTRMLFPPRDRCFSGYDGFTSLGPLSELGYQCKFQGTHDDLSVIEQLPEGTAVFTQIRDPIDRLLSSYEFSLEVAARYVTRKRDPSSDKTKTDDVWPWSDLVPYMMEDIQKRIDAEDMREVDPKVWVKQVDVEGEEVYYNAARKKTMKAEQRKHLDTITPGGALVLDDMDPYDNDMVMPLREYVKLPIVHDLVFNGETFQVLGMTNISSHWELARDIRKCARANEHDNDQYLEFTEILLSKSKSILDKLWHVGMMSDLDASISSLSATSGWNLYGRGYNYSEELSKQMRSFVDNLEGTAKEREFFVSLDIDRVKRDLMEKEAKLTELQYEPDKQDEARMLKEVIAALSKKREDLEAEEIALKNAMTDPEAMLEWKKDAASIYFADDFGREPAGMRIIDSHLGCTTGASKRNAKMKMKTMMKFQDRYGRQLSFSKEKRAELPQDILDYVASHNKIDSELVEIANAIYTDVKTKQMEEGVLQSLNPEGKPNAASRFSSLLVFSLLFFSFSV